MICAKYNGETEGGRVGRDALSGRSTRAEAAQLPHAIFTSTRPSTTDLRSQFESQGYTLYDEYISLTKGSFY